MAQDVRQLIVEYTNDLHGYLTERLIDPYANYLLLDETVENYFQIIKSWDTETWYSLWEQSKKSISIQTLKNPEYQDKLFAYLDQLSLFLNAEMQADASRKTFSQSVIPQNLEELKRNLDENKRLEALAAAAHKRIEAKWNPERVKTYVETLRRALENELEFQKLEEPQKVILSKAIVAEIHYEVKQENLRGKTLSSQERTNQVVARMRKREQFAYLFTSGTSERLMAIIPILADDPQIKSALIETPLAETLEFQAYLETHVQGVPKLSNIPSDTVAIVTAAAATAHTNQHLNETRGASSSEVAEFLNQTKNLLLLLGGAPLSPVATAQLLLWADEHMPIRLVIEKFTGVSFPTIKELLLKTIASSSTKPPVPPTGPSPLSRFGKKYFDALKNPFSSWQIGARGFLDRVWETFHGLHFFSFAQNFFSGFGGVATSVMGKGLTAGLDGLFRLPSGLGSLLGRTGKTVAVGAAKKVGFAALITPEIGIAVALILIVFFFVFNPFDTKLVESAALLPPTDVLPVGGPPPIGGGPPTGTCEVPKDGLCSLDNPLTNLRGVFGDQAENAAQICGRESGWMGGKAAHVINDSCLSPEQRSWVGADKPRSADYSVGLFQINMLSQGELAFQDSPEGASLKARLAEVGKSGKNCYEAFSNWQEFRNSANWPYIYCQVGDQVLLDACVGWFQDPTNNTIYARHLYDSRGWGPWSTATGCQIDKSPPGPAPSPAPSTAFVLRGPLSSNNIVVSASNEISSPMVSCSWTNSKSLAGGVNANYFKSDGSPVGWVGYGLGDVKDYGAGTYPAELVFQINNSGEAEIAPYVFGTNNPNLLLAVSGTNLSFNSGVHHRTALGIVGNEVVLVVIPNATTQQLQTFMNNLGASSALQLDGGGSSAFCASGGKALFGNERPVPVSIGLKTGTISNVPIQ